VGGRIHSDASTWGDGLVSEWCGEFIGSDHATMLQLIARCGLSTLPLGDGAADSGPNLVYLGGRYISGDELTAELAQIAPLVREQRQRAGFPTTHAHFTAAGQQLLTSWQGTKPGNRMRASTHG
jgi:monoamine oxidase